MSVLGYHQTMRSHRRPSWRHSITFVCSLFFLGSCLAACGNTIGDPDRSRDARETETQSNASNGSHESGTPPSAERDLPIPDPVVVFYVSSSVGSDRWSGALANPNADGTDGPKATLDGMLSLLNGAVPGTHVLMRRGDEWMTSTSLEIGAAAGTVDKPVILGAYGMGNQPAVIADAEIQTFVIRGNRNGNSQYFRMDDLRLSSTRPSKGQLAVYINESYHPEAPHHITFSKLTIENNGAGMTMYGHDHLVHGSRIANNNAGMGVYVNAENVSFQHNEFENNGLPPPDVFVHSLYISHSDGVLFEHNTVYSATDGIKVRRTHNGIFRHNTFYGLLTIGIHLGGDSKGGSRNNRIESNLFYDNAKDIVIKSESGIQVELLDGLVIANNILRTGPAGTGGYGAYITITDLPATNVSIVNNLIYEGGNKTGIRVNNEGLNIECLNNVIGQFGSGATYDLTGSVIQSNNLKFASTSAFDALALTDPAAFDFEPTTRSTMLIDQGADVSGVLTEDYAGASRPQGEGFDIGPYEFNR